MSGSRNTVESMLFVEEEGDQDSEGPSLQDKYTTLRQKYDALEHQLEDVLWENSHTINTLTVAQNDAEHATLELQATRQYYQALFDHAYDPTVVISTDGRVQSANSAFERVLGYAPSELIGRNVSVLMDEPDATQHDGYLQRYLETGKPRIIGIDREVFARHKDGTRVPVRLAVTEVNSPDGHTNFVGSLTDLTAVKQVEAQLAHAQKLESIGQLAAGIAHELNTPAQFIGDNVTFIASAIDDLEKFVDAVVEMVASHKQCSNDLAKRLAEIGRLTEEIDLPFLREEIPGALNQALEGVERISSIVGAMKDFSHPGADSLEFIDLNRAIESTITVARSEWKYVAEVNTDLEERLPQIPCFASDINQVFLNLIVNSAHAIAEQQEQTGSEEKGNIHISTSLTDDTVIARVRDDGIGIDKDALSKVFDQFYTTKEVGKGTGQGLAIAYASIVDKHKGSINVESERGKGACFTVRIPLHPAE